MQPLIYLILLSNFLFSNSYGSTLKPVKIELNQLLDIRELINLGIKADGYIIEEKYWITTLSDEEISKIEASGFQYSLIEQEGIEKNVSFLFGDLKTSFNSCGNQLTVYYNQSKKLSFMSIEIYDLRENRLGRRIGYNIPPSNYECKFSSHNWSDGIYLVQIETNKKESIHKIFQKRPLIKKV